jgi:hypothetical protein
VLTADRRFTDEHKTLSLFKSPVPPVVSAVFTAPSWDESRRLQTLVLATVPCLAIAGSLRLRFAAELYAILGRDPVVARAALR